MPASSMRSSGSDWRRDSNKTAETLADNPGEDSRDAHDELSGIRASLRGAYQRLRGLLAGGADLSLLTEQIGYLRQQRAERLRSEHRLATGEVYLEPGDLLLDGRYELVQKIQKGGHFTRFAPRWTASVWTAKDEMDGSIVALKITHTEPSAARDDFFLKAQRLSQLSHPNVVRVLDPRCSDDEVDFFVMEYAGARSLYAAVMDGSVTARQCLDIAESVCGAVQYLHENRIMHGDISPDNIVLHDDGVPILVDFDVSKVTPAGPASPVESRDDVSAVLRTLVFALDKTNTPWDHGSPVADQQIARLPIGDALKKVLRAAVAADSQLHYQSASEFCTALRQARAKDSLASDLKLFWMAVCEHLQQSLTSPEMNTWIVPLAPQITDDGLALLAPNRFVKAWVEQHYGEQIKALCRDLSQSVVTEVRFSVGIPNKTGAEHSAVAQSPPTIDINERRAAANLNPDLTFDTFVEGKSKQIALAACIQIAKNPGSEYNPLFIYGDVGMGKTHLMHAVGNMLLEKNPDAKVMYVQAERFVAEMIRAPQHNGIDKFKKTYRSLNALLIDDRTPGKPVRHRVYDLPRPAAHRRPCG